MKTKRRLRELRELNRQMAVAMMQLLKHATTQAPDGPVRGSLLEAQDKLWHQLTRLRGRSTGIRTGE